MANFPRLRINPILPTIYGDALSYLETLNRVVCAINQLSDAFNNQLVDDIGKWIEENYNELFFYATYDPETETIIFAKGGEINGRG